MTPKEMLSIMEREVDLINIYRIRTTSRELLVAGSITATEYNRDKGIFSNEMLSLVHYMTKEHMLSQYGDFVGNAYKLPVSKLILQKDVDWEKLTSQEKGLMNT
mmetsp:Transcript_14039/g.13649  ORF Transcript_14039/g.13649 Transcript_14039/m.13649 type:complete len:104 (-) Transcript_14039:950-1261(-)